MYQIISPLLITVTYTIYFHIPIYGLNFVVSLLRFVCYVWFVGYSGYRWFDRRAHTKWWTKRKSFTSSNFHTFVAFIWQNVLFTNVNWNRFNAWNLWIRHILHHFYAHLSCNRIKWFRPTNIRMKFNTKIVHRLKYSFSLQLIACYISFNVLLRFYVDHWFCEACNCWYFEHRTSSN